MSTPKNILYSALPGVDTLLQSPVLAEVPPHIAKLAIREELASLRMQIGNGTLTSPPTNVAEKVRVRVQKLQSPKLRPVLNATGVVLHTNLGRAPWAPEAVDAVRRVVSGYCNLELNLQTGKRGGRLDGPKRLLKALTGAEDAVIVNNGAAALMLAMTATAKGQEVIVSRGELVEIGGSFRIPDVVASGGATLVEVGTTNRTRISDYTSAITENTAALLRVHPSNFSIIGFTSRTTRAEVVAAAKEAGVISIEDLGSGALGADYSGSGEEPTVDMVVSSGMDLVTFSGDKLLGGPQAGIIVGKSALITKLRGHPMYRALRVGKETIAALEAVLLLHLNKIPGPISKKITMPPIQLQENAQELLIMLKELGVAAKIETGQGFVGGGASPDSTLTGETVTIDGANEETMLRLRTGTPAVVARLSDGVLIIDLRTIDTPKLQTLATSIAAAINQETK